MAFYYVKSGGTATGDGGRFASQQTGSFATLGASAYYDGVSDCFTTSTTKPNLGDIICVSDASTFTSAGTISWHNAAPVTTATGSTDALLIVSVSDTNCDQYARETVAVQEDAQSGGSLQVLGASADGWQLTIAGLYLKSENDIQNLGSSNVKYFECKLEVNGTGDTTIRNLTGYDSDYYDCDFVGTNSGSQLAYQSSFTLYGGTVSNTDTGVTDLIQRPLNIRMIGVDLSGLPTVTDFLHAPTASYRVQLYKCKLPTITNWIATAEFDRESTLTVVNCGATSAEAEYYFYHQAGGEIVEHDTNYYRSAGNAWRESGTQTSLKVTTTAGCTHNFPFSFEFPSTYAALSSASTDTLTFYLQSTTSGLTDADVKFIVYYNDGTNKHQINKAINAAFEPLETGTALTSSTETWNDSTGFTKYEISVTTSGDVGSDCVPVILCYIAKPSVTIYICPTPDIGA